MEDDTALQPSNPILPSAVSKQSYKLPLLPIIKGHVRYKIEVPVYISNCTARTLGFTAYNNEWQTLDVIGGYTEVVCKATYASSFLYIAFKTYPYSLSRKF